MSSPPRFYPTDLTDDESAILEPISPRREARRAALRLVATDHPERHLLVDALGLVLTVQVHAADIQDRAAVPLVMCGIVQS